MLQVCQQLCPCLPFKCPPHLHTFPFTSLRIRSPLSPHSPHEACYSWPPRLLRLWSIFLEQTASFPPSKAFSFCFPSRFKNFSFPPLIFSTLHPVCVCPFPSPSKACVCVCVRVCVWACVRVSACELTRHESL